jgi:hypothetical protein
MKASRTTIGLAFTAVLAGALAAAPASAAPSSPSTASAVTQAAVPGFDCNPMASIDDGVTKVASGRASCLLPPDTTVGVTVVLYVDGVNLGSTYRECPQPAGADGVCEGYPVARAVSGQACARVSATYTLPAPEGFQQRSSSVGNGCP